MSLVIHRPEADVTIKRAEAQYVVGTLGLLIDVVKKDPTLVEILEQTRNEVVSLLAEPARDASILLDEAA